MNQTERALLSRGFDTRTAKSLVQQKHTISSLKTMDTNVLQGLGIPPAQVDSLLAEGRPPIPSATLTKLLFDCRFTCCVCRTLHKPIVIHHIVPWEKSRSHDANNLVVLCLEDHGSAHTKNELSKNLDANTLRNLKQEWEKSVRRLDSEAIIRASSVEYSSWAYFNHLRLFEMAEAYGVKLRELNGYQNLLSLGYIFDDGTLRPRNKNLMYMYAGPEILHLHQYTKALITEVLRKAVVFNISDYLDKGDLPHLLACGDLVYVDGAHSFKRMNRTHRGFGQITTGTRSANGVSVRFTFDAWEALSSSAYADWLSGTKRAGTLLQVRSVEREDGRLLIRGTAIAISNGFGTVKNRDYTTNYGKFVYFDPDEDNED